MDITKLKTRLRFRSSRKTTNEASLTDVVNDFETIASELNTSVKVSPIASEIVGGGSVTAHNPVSPT